MIAEGITKANRPEAIEPYDKVWGVGVSGLDEEISPFPRVNKMLEKTKNATSLCVLCLCKTKCTECHSYQKDLPTCQSFHLVHKLNF